MRLSQEDIKIIKNVLLKIVSDAKIFLFGSRVDDFKKGGDIDLFVETTQNIELKDELLILTQLELSGITRKIDLIFQTPFRNKQDFFETIKDKAVVL